MSRKFKEGRKLKSLQPMAKVSPYIMKHRNGSSNLIMDKINLEHIEKYLKEKRAEGYDGLTLMHVIIAAYIRTVSCRPAINRFIRGQRVYARNNIEICLAIKTDMTLEADETVIKAEFQPQATISDVYKQVNGIIEEYRNNPGGDFDQTAKILNLIPGLLMKFVVWFLNLLDYFGLIPRKLTKLSPFHGSFFITSMGSLGIPPIYHHLYDFGNVPVFLSFGSKRRENVILDDGTVKKNKYVDFTVVTDERICDGFYFASALKVMKSIFKNPWVLDNPPDKVIEDIE